MTPESNTIYSLLLFFALVALTKWWDHRHRISLHAREGVSTDLLSGEEAAREPAYSAPRSFSSRSARNQSSQGEPSWRPRASQ